MKDFPKPWLTATHYVYELVDAAGVTLYVGCTMKIGNRLAFHSLAQPWWPEVAHVEVFAYPDQAEGLQAEAALIKSTQPLHNIVHTSRHSEATAGGWATRRLKTEARHANGELCAPHLNCRHCAALRQQSVSA